MPQHRLDLLGGSLGGDDRLGDVEAGTEASWRWRTASLGPSCPEAASRLTSAGTVSVAEEQHAGPFRRRAAARLASLPET